MVQEQIVDYINAQMKLGVSRDTIKTTLTGAGWVAADVEDTLKKIEMAKTATSMAPAQSPAQPVQQSQPAMTRPAMPVSFTAKPAEPAIAAKPFSPIGSTSPAPQTIKVSDLVSSSPVRPMTTSPAMKSPLTGAAMGAGAPVTAKPSTYTADKSHGSRGALITDIVLIIVILAVGALAGFLYMQNNDLNTRINAMNGQSATVASQLSALQAKMSASTTALAAKTQELQTELSFYVVPSGAPFGVTSTIAISGTVSGGGKALYAITTVDGARIYVANSKSANVITALTPLLGTASSTASTTQFSGTFVPGSDSITLTAIGSASL